MEQPNPFGHLFKEMNAGGKTYKYYDLQGLQGVSMMQDLRSFHSQLEFCLSPL